VIVDAVHPAHIRHVARGSRAPRDGLFRTRTAVDVPECRPGDLEPAGTLSPAWDRRGGAWFPSARSSPTPILRLAGIPYFPLPAPEAGVAEALSPSGLAAHLSGIPAGGPAADRLAAAFRWSPLADPLAPESRTGSPPDGRGSEFDPDAQRSVDLDGREAASEALAAFVRDNLLVDGTRAYMRFAPFARCIAFGSGKGETLLHLSRDADFRGAPPFAAERHVEAASFEGLGESARLPESMAGVLALLAGDSGDADIAIGLSAAACAAAAWLRAGERARPGVDPGPARRISERIAPVHMAARTGVLGRLDLGLAIPVIRDALDHAIAAGDAAGRDLAVLVRAATYLTQVAAPRLASRQVLAEEDADAILGLAR
jgi:hypothetical protein